MTREEALILWLPVIADGVKNLPKCKEALDVAIRALKNEQTDEDLISRQAVITMLNKIENAVEDGDGFQFNEWIDYAKDIPSAEKTTLRTEKTTITDGDLISRQAVIQALKDNVVEIGGEEYSGMGVCEEEIESIVNDIPSAEKTAKWYDKKMTIKKAHGIAYGRWGCSVCKRKFPQKSNYCPNCGAKMKESEEEE